MLAATAPYLTWLNTTAAQALQTAAQARAAASAFDAAFAATVPPPVIAANRTALATLTATNILGINTRAIAATEAHYSEMWAQDAAAMYGYASAPAVASTLTQFMPPAELTDEAGLADRAAGISVVPQALQQLSQPLTDGLDSVSSLVSPASSGASTMSSTMSATSSLSSVVKTLSPSAALASTAVGSDAEALPGVLSAGPGQSRWRQPKWARPCPSGNCRFRTRGPPRPCHRARLH